MSSPQNEVETDESSGVTTLRPVPVKPARLLDLAESDSTTYFSASELLERGKALAAHSSEPAPPAAHSSEPAPPAIEPTASVLEAAPPPGWRAQFQRASLARRTAAILLPLLCLLLLVKPQLEKLGRAPASKPSSSVATTSAATPVQRAVPQPLASVETVALARGVTAARAAADSVATGDFSRAAALYRELSRREPRNLAYREAARILNERVQPRAP